MTKDQLAARLQHACGAVMAAEQELTEIDSKFGDADHGLTMTKIAGAISAAVEAADGGIEEGFADRESAAQLHRLLHNLPEPYKEVFSLRTFGELPFGQIGELFGKTESWARVTYFRARQKLKEGLDGT